MKAKINIKNVYSYIIGNYRYQLYYSKYFSWLMRTFIKRQIAIRIKSMDEECFNNGQCKMCGCKTTALQMANKACNKPCYPSMLSRNKWWLLKRTKGLTIKGEYWTYRQSKFKLENE